MEMNLGDIAKEAGVSRATISRVINGSPTVKESTAKMVRRTIERLGYVRPQIRPGPKPRQGNSQHIRTGSIALVTMGLTRHLLQEPTMAMVIEEIQAACKLRNLNFLLDQMTSVDDLPNCIRSRQVGGAILMVAGRPPNLSECLDTVSGMLPTVHLFSPGHPVASMLHVSVNDVAIGELAFTTLKSEGCRSMAVVNVSSRFHEALLVRGRSFTDRAAQEGMPVRTFTAATETGSAGSYWPQPLTIFTELTSLASLLSELEAPVGIFLTSETAVPEVHKALVRGGLIDEGNGRGRLIVAGNTAEYFRELEPKPLQIDLCFHELIDVAMDRLLNSGHSLPENPLTFLVPPRLSPSSVCRSPVGEPIQAVASPEIPRHVES